MDDIVKYILLSLLLLPFVALLTDAIGKTEGMMLRVANRLVDRQGSECTNFMDLDLVFDSDHELVFGQCFHAVLLLV
jgi:uncharacterized Tic20 family protein